LFKQSLAHFHVDSAEHSMTRNFLVATAWQAGRLEDAVKYIEPMQQSESKLDGLMTVLAKRLSLPDAEDRAFEVVNCLRIAAALINTGNSERIDIQIRETLEAIARRVGTDHPYEHWLKWLGILHWQDEQYERAESCFAMAETICMKGDFTMQTIGSSIALLQFVSTRMRGAAGKARTFEGRFLAVTDRLRSQSPSFDAYLRASQNWAVMDQMNKGCRPDAEALWRHYTYLPFFYA